MKQALKDAYENGLNDTLADEMLSDNALLFINEEGGALDTDFTDEEQDALVEAYHKGFKSG